MNELGTRYSSIRDLIRGWQFAETVFGQREGGAEFGEGHINSKCQVSGVKCHCERSEAISYCYGIALGEERRPHKDKSCQFYRISGSSSAESRTDGVECDSKTFEGKFQDLQ